MKNIEQLLPFIFPFFFVGLWCIVLRVLSVTSGWTDLAEKFQSQELFRGEYHRFQSGKLNRVGFKGSLDIGVNECGLYLVPILTFRLFHKPLLIPWGEIEAEPFERFLYKGYRLTFHSVPTVALEVSARRFEQMAEHVKPKISSQQSPPLR